MNTRLQLVSRVSGTLVALAIVLIGIAVAADQKPNDKTPATAATKNSLQKFTVQFAGNTVDCFVKQ